MPITSIELIVTQLKITSQYCWKTSNCVMSPTPAGTKNSPIVLVKNIETWSTCSSLTQPLLSATKSRIIPIIEPGIRPPNNLLAISPSRQNKSKVKICLSIFISLLVWNKTLANHLHKSLSPIWFAKILVITHLAIHCDYPILQSSSQWQGLLVLLETARRSPINLLT